MTLPYSKKLKVAKLELSNENFISVIQNNINTSDARSIRLDKFIFPSVYRLAEFSSLVYHERETFLNPLENDWVLLTTSKNSGDGYFGAAYWNPDHQQVVIAHKGTKLKSLNDIWADYEGILSNEYTSQMSSAITFSNKIAVEVDKFNKNQSANLTLSITGHSLGGWLAQITTFSTEYLTKGESDFFVKSRKEGFHAHTVVFDSPGCKDMLLKMESDFDVRYSGRSHSSFFLDVTIYLSAPNLVNTLHSHLNVGNIYRVFIENIPHRSSSWDCFHYTMESHNMDNIKKAFSSKGICNSSEKIMKVIDWPLVKKGLGGIIAEKIINIFKNIPNEYEQFHESADCSNYYNPTPDDSEYCTLRYQVQSVEKGKCSANIFTQPEFEFLEGCHRLKQFSMLSNADDLFSSLDTKTKGVLNANEIEEILHGLEMKQGEGRGFIKYGIGEKLQKLIICVKNALFVFPTIHHEIKSKLNNLDAFNDVYRKQSLDYLKSIEYIEFKQATIDFGGFLKNSNLQFFHLIFKVHPTIGIKKIYKALKNTKTEYQTFFLSLKQLLNLEQFFALNKFIKQSDKEVSMLFVVESNNEAVEKRELLKTYFKELFMAFDYKPKYKFILVSQKNYDIKFCFGDKNKFNCEITDDTEIKLDNLTYDSQKQLLEKKIYFQGRKISLGTLITSESSHLVDEETLSKLINNEAIEVGKALPDLGDIESYYIDRIFKQSKIKKCIENDGYFYLTYNGRIDPSKLREYQDILLISYSSCDFDKICIEHENRNIHWLKEEDKGFMWLNSRGALSRLRRYLDTDDGYEYHELDERIVVISSVSGAGKSTVLTKLAQNMENKDATLWVVRINLNDYTGKLANVDFHDDKDTIFKFIMEIALINSPLEQELFKHRLNAIGKVALLFDGFDEIVPKYEKKIVELLKVLKYSKVEKLWITTRPHMKNELEDILSVLSYTLRPLSREDQVLFIQNYFCKILKLSITENFENFANKLLDSVLQPISDQSKEFTGIPLQIKMLIEVQEEFYTPYELSNNIKLNLSKKLSILNLYKLFVEKKYKSHLAEKQILDPTKSGPEYEILHESFLKKYTLLSLDALLWKNDSEKFLEDDEITEMKKYKQQVKDGKENSGFISHIVDEKPIFIHYSFTQYFAALFYFNNVKREKIWKYFCDQIYGKKHDLTTIFFDHMVTDGETNYEVHIAVLNSDEKELKRLLTNAGKVENFTSAIDRVGRTALHVAAAYGYYDVTMTLLEHRFSVAAEDLFGWKPIRYADKYSHWDIADLLLKNGANVDDMCETMMRFASVAELPQETLLHEAAEKGLLTLLNALLKSKSKFINTFDVLRQTPLHLAADNEIAKILITNGADTEAKNYKGETPIFLAKSAEVVKFLIKQGADFHARNNDGNTLLHRTVKGDRKEIVALLISHGADIEAKNGRGETPLFFAQSEDVVKFLIGKGADINVKSIDGNTPLHEVVRRSQDIVELLILHGADIEAKNCFEETPLFFALRKEVVEFLISLGANFNTRNIWGNTPLHEAVKKSKKIVEVLISHGADIKAKGLGDKTPLFYADRKEIIEYLIAQGADITERSGKITLANALRWMGEKIAELGITRPEFVQILLNEVSNAD